MKRIVKIITVMLLVFAMVGTAFAADDTFVPSIGYKDHPDVVPTPDGNLGVLITPEGEFVANITDEAIVIIPISKVEDEEIKKIYEDLVNGTTELPYDDDDDMVIRDLIYVDLTDDEIKDLIEGDDNNLEITLDLDVEPGTKVVVMVLSENEWVPVEVTNNGDGTVTLVLPDVGLIAISVPVADDPIKTGDNTDTKLMAWGIVCVLSIAAVIALVVVDMKKRHTN